MTLENWGESREQRLRDDEQARAAVAQHEIIIRRRQQRVDRDRHDPRLDRAEEGGGKVDAVEQAEHDALLRRDAEAGDEIGEAVDPLGEVGVAIGPRSSRMATLSPRPAARLRPMRSTAAL